MSLTPVTRADRLGRRLTRDAVELGGRLAEEIHGVASCLRNGPTGPQHEDRGFPPPDVLRLTTILHDAERSLAENILPFWARHAPDVECGGFITHLDRTGCRFGPTDKYVLMQARMIWTMAAAHRYGLARQGYLEIAGQGVRFLIDRMWDPEYGGFFWSVKRDGSLLDVSKSVVGQAFAIYALAEYAIAARNPEALVWAERTFDVLAEKMTDGHLGFREEFARDWTPALGEVAEHRTVAHIHLAEALTTLIEASRRAVHCAALGRIVDLLITRPIHPRYRYVWDPFDLAWRQRTFWWCRLFISYGHGVKLALQILRAADILGRPRERVRESVLGLIDHALAYGFDHVRGGLAKYGPPAGSVYHAIYLPEERLTKEWWQQAEMLVATLQAYYWTRLARYLVAFDKQFDWIWRHQTDHNGGDWFEATTWREGRPLCFEKGHDWKDPYHNARALMEVSRLLRTMGIKSE